jgi:Fatty acid hydroxylase superfamily
LHYKLAHRPLGAKFFRDHINHHHTIYAKDHLASETYRREAGNLTPFFLIPVIAAGAGAYFVLPPDFFVVQAAACAASFYAPVFFDREYHAQGPWFGRFAWFKRKQELHFVHHRHADSDFAVIDFFRDRVLGTFRASVKSASELVAYKIEGDCR